MHSPLGEHVSVVMSRLSLQSLSVSQLDENPFSDLTTSDASDGLNMQRFVEALQNSLSPQWSSAVQHLLIQV